MTREEAVNTLRNIYQTDKMKEALGVLIPEFRESNDERTRKRLTEFISDVKKISESGRSSWAIRKEDAEMCTTFLAYLEKHKEQKSTWSEEDERIISDACKKLEKLSKYEKRVAKRDNWEYTDYLIDKLKSLRPS